MADKTQKIQMHKFQAPKGTRDFYPADMAVRRYIESVWREVSINHGFEEIDGPTFEHLELYTRKSGQEIVNQLFSFKRAGGDTDYALRPEFTPTLARMYAARAGQLPKPTKWFCIPNFFRAERPQRGRLREFFQWNIDVLGDDSPRADAEVIACVVDVLKRFGLGPDQVKVKIWHRSVVEAEAQAAGIGRSVMSAWFSLLDSRGKIPDEQFIEEAKRLNMTPTLAQELIQMRRQFRSTPWRSENRKEFREQLRQKIEPYIGILVEKMSTEAYRPIYSLFDELLNLSIHDWCEPDDSIVRGLAYYTGTVFEVHETTGKERAIAGGGRYDGLVEMFGGPKTPAVGVAMGDVVLRLLLEDRGLLPSDAEMADRLGARPDVFVISSKDETDVRATKLISQLRSDNLHVRQSYKSTRNVGKLLGDAGKCHARCAIILGDELADEKVTVKELETGEQEIVEMKALIEYIKRMVHK